MNKQTFLTELRRALSGLPRDDLEERIAFYGEMIDDRMEEGMSEEEAISGIGTVEGIRKQIVADIPLPKLVKEKVRPKRALRAWEIVLIVLGFPLWFPLAVAAGAVILSLYLVFWVLILSLWAVEVALLASVPVGIAATVVYFAQNAAIPALMTLGAAMFIAGFSIFAFIGCVAASNGILDLTKKIGVGFKSLFIGKENAK